MISGINLAEAVTTAAEQRRDAWIAGGEKRAVDREGIYFVARRDGRELARHTFLVGLLDLLP
jgi:hypothetical protein